MFSQKIVSFPKNGCAFCTLYTTMMNFKKYITQNLNELKLADSLIKVIVAAIFLSYLAFCRTCNFNPIAGERFPINEHVVGYTSSNFGKGAKPCYLGNKRLFVERENQDENFMRDFFLGGNRFYVWHLQYEDDDGTMKPILTYKFEVRGGIGAVVRGTGFGIYYIDADSFAFVYEAEPYDGITIEPSPYSEKIIVQKGSYRGKLASECVCYMGWSN